MSYCVHCGVQLNEQARTCPLCGTPVIDPSAPAPSPDAELFFPTRPADVEPVSKKELAALLSLMLATASLCCALLNLLLGRGVPWCLYVIGAAVMLWLWLVPPLIARKMPLWLRGVVDVAAVCLYIYLIALALGGGAWFRQVIVPVGFCAAGVWVALCITGATIGRRSLISTITLLLVGLAVFLLAVELFVDLYLTGRWQPSWSLITLTVLAAFIVPLVVIRRVPSLRQEARKRFHL